MRRLQVAAALVALLPHPALAWETIVRDAHGLRTVELRGESNRGAGLGVALVCYPDGADAALIYATSPSKDYSLRPGAPVSLAIGPISVTGELASNDSTDTTVIAEGVDLAGVIAAIGGAGQLEVSIAEMRNVESTVPRNGWEASLAEFSQACDL